MADWGRSDIASTRGSSSHTITPLYILTHYATTMTQPVTFTIRPATAADIPSITAIYGYHVLNGVATFETEPPSEDEMAKRQSELLALNMPYFVAESSSRVVGYAYAGKHKERVAYDNTVDDSIFLSHEFTGLGIGQALLDRLVAECVARGWRQMVSVIADPEGTGAGSAAIHRKRGFRTVGVLDKVGWKLGRWIDVGYYQCPLGVGAQEPPPRR